MGERLENLAGAAAAAGVKALDDEAFADMSARNHEIVDVGIMIVLRIRNRGFQALAYVLGDALAREFQVRESGLHLLAADELRNQVEFLRADAQHAGDGFGLVVRKTARMCGLAHLVPRLGGARRRRALGLLVRRMAVEDTGRSKLAELVAAHFL